MPTALQSLFLGTNNIDRLYGLLIVAGLFAVTLACYAVGVFYVSGGLVFIPFYAAIVGMVGALWVGYRQHGLLFAWAVTYAALLGYMAYSSFFGLWGRPLAYRISSFLASDGLGFFGVQALILGAIAFSAGHVAQVGLKAVKRHAATTK
ncbi:hypothetical protein [Haladaptatus sp. CMSO5]|uniref:hypothetical protein n=1 Tax=Haladaptatus sp. CMSO5 TaxID=3120514 RepID=UPI002FCE22D3